MTVGQLWSDLHKDSEGGRYGASGGREREKERKQGEEICYPLRYE